jgi:anti-anti-sigma regulatory factor
MLTLKRKVSDTRPLMPLSGITGYAQPGIRRSSRTQVGRSMPGQTGIAVSVLQVQGRAPVTVLHPDAALNAGSYLDLIAKAREVYQVGTRDVVLDMRDVPAISSSGLAALYSAAVVLRGEEPPDPEAGWNTLHTMAHELESGSHQPHFKLLGPQPQVKQVLERAGFRNFLEIHDDLEAAVASF